MKLKIKSLGRRCVALDLDVREPASIERMVSEATAAFGQIHILVNNAGCNVRKPALDVTWDDWNLVLDTNLRGSFFVAQAVARGMIEHGYGRIINIGSVTSVFGFAGLAPYCASRGGIRQLTMSLADDWGRHGVTVNCLAPGWFKTEQNKVLYEDPEWVEYLTDRIPVKRAGLPHDLDGAVVFLASEASRYITGRRCWWMVGFRPALRGLRLRANRIPSVVRLKCLKKAEKPKSRSSLTTPKLNYVWGPVHSE